MLTAMWLLPTTIALLAAQVTDSLLKPKTTARGDVQLSFERHLLFCHSGRTHQVAKHQAGFYNQFPFRGALV
jgi:hypothetical protein